MIKEKNVYSLYLQYRDQVMRYTHEDMNLKLTSDDQVYIAIFDIPIESSLVGFQTETLALVFGLNTHLYHGTGTAVTELEKEPEIRKAATSLLISAHQVLSGMTLTQNTEFYNSDKIRVYLKTAKGIYFRELDGKTREDRFINMLLMRIMEKIRDFQRSDETKK